MPLPAARHPVPDVGTARDQGSGADACADPQIRGLLWRRQSEHREVRARHVREVRRSHIRDVFEEASAASLPWQARGGCIGQRQIPPCRTSQALALEISGRHEATVFATVQSAVGADRTRLEVGPSHGNPQPLLRYAKRTALRGLDLFRSLATTKFDAKKIMRHYLRRYV